MKYPPRPYQVEAVDRLRDNFRAGIRRQVLVMPTGSGKTRTAALVIEAALRKGNRVIFLAHRKELIDQCSKTLDEFGIDHGIIKAKHWRTRPSAPVQVASVQTLVKREKPRAEILMLDECVTGDTRIVTDIGEMTIADVEHRHPRFALSYNGSAVVMSRIMDFWSSGTKDTIVIQTASGRSIRCTRNHCFLTRSGWKKADLLNRGDEIQASVSADAARTLAEVRGVACDASCSGTRSCHAPKKSGERSSTEWSPSRRCVRADAENGSSLSARTSRHTCDAAEQAATASTSSATIGEPQAGTSRSTRMSVKQFSARCSEMRACCIRTPRATPLGLRSIMSAWSTSFDRVTSVRSAGTCEVFDITIEGTQCFFANSLLAHNCHRGLNATNQQILAWYPNALSLGLTATPWRLDGRGLGSMYETIVAPLTAREAVDQGYLLPLRIYEPDRPDLKGIGRTGGDYNQKQLHQRMGENPKRIGSIVENYLEFGEQQRAAVFPTGVEDSRDIVRKFVEAGIAAEHLDGTMNDSQREAVLARFEQGETRVVSSVDVITEGFDLPSLGCIILARPTLSLTRFLQMIGRGMRPWENQQYCVVLDHAGCVHKLGDPLQDRNWTLEDRKKMKDDEEPGRMLTCPECALMRPANVFHCPKCAANQLKTPWQAAMFGGLPIEAEGRLVERPMSRDPNALRCTACRSESVTLEPYGDLRIRVKCNACGETTYQPDRVAAKMASEQRRAAELVRLEAVCEQKGFKPAWVTHQYRDTFGEPPPRPKETP